MLSDLLQDLRHSLRLLRRTPGFSAVAVLVLALGIGANTAVFSLVDALVLQPRPGRIDRLVGVFSRNRQKTDEYKDFSYGQYKDLRDRSGVFEALMAHTFTTLGVRDGDMTKQSFASVVSANYFDTLGVRLAAGRAFTPDEERPGAAIPVIIASYPQWRKTGFDPSFIGRTVRVSARDFTIVGVAPRGFSGTMTLMSPEWWLPLGAYDIAVNEMFKQRGSGLGDRANFALNLAGALKPGTAKAAAEKALDPVARALEQQYPESDRDRMYVLAGLPRLGVESSPENDTTPSVIASLLAGMASLVLVVACLNLANLLLARGAARRKEIAIRLALGSRRGRIVRQLLVEGMVLSTIGAAAGVVIAWWTTTTLTASLSATIPLGVEITVEPSARVVIGAVAFALFSTVCFALGPAWTLSRPAVQGDLKGEPSRITRRIGTGPALVAIQLAVSLALVAAGGLFVRASVEAASADAGFPLEHQLVFNLDPTIAGYNETQTRDLYRRVVDRLRGLAGIEQVGLASTVPFGEMSEGRSVYVPGQTEKRRPEFDIITASYFETLRLPMIRGRAFTAADDAGSTGRREVIIDVRLSQRLFGDADPVGRVVEMPPLSDDRNRIAYTIIGVVPMVRHDIFITDKESRGHVYVPYGSTFRGRMTMHVRTAAGAGDASMLQTILRELRQIDPKLPVLLARSFTAHRDSSISEWSVRTAATLFSTFGGLALLLAAIGVYGLKAYDVSRRTREIGIRMALGATAANVQRLVLGEGLRTTVAGLVSGLLLALGIGKLVSGLLYKVSPFDPIVLTIAIVALSTATLVACYLPARRATRVVPLEALRSE
jgi:predicted permease